MKRIILAIFTAIALLVSFMAIGASANATPGNNKVATKTISHNGSYVVVDIHYDIDAGCNNTYGGCALNIDYMTFNAVPGQLLDALCVDFEATPGNYVGNTCAGSGSQKSSSTYNDINASPGTYTWSSSDSWHDFITFTNQDSPAFRIRTYGLANDHGSTQRVDGFVAAS